MVTVTQEVLLAIGQRSHGNPLHVVDVQALGAALQLTPAELRPALQALQVTGFILFEDPVLAPGTVRLTARGAKECLRD